MPPPNPANSTRLHDVITGFESRDQNTSGAACVRIAQAVERARHCALVCVSYPNPLIFIFVSVFCQNLWSQKLVS